MSTARRLGLAIAGVQKGGTTSLFGYLRRHPALLAPEVKETHFFDDEAVDWSAPDYARLLALYPPAAPDRILIDATPVYSFWPNALERLKAHNPALRLICIFRDPIDRAWSQWRMSRARGWDTLGFSAAIREGRRRVAMDTPAPSLKVHSYVERGLYAQQLRRALTLFSREQMLLLLSDALSTDPAAVLSEVATFIGIPPFPPGPPQRAHVTEPDGEQMSAADEAWLRRLFRDEVAAFATLSGLDVSHWRTMRS